MKNQKEYLDHLLKEAENISEIVKQKYSSYPDEQLNWKPDSKSWSIGEVYNHIINTNRLYYDLLKGRIKSYSADEPGNLPVKHTISGKFIIKAVSPGSRKVKTFKVFEPASSRMGQDIYKRFADQHSKLVDLIKKSAGVNINKIKISSPVSRLLRYNLGDVLAILVYHTQRHLDQIERVSKLYKLNK